MSKSFVENQKRWGKMIRKAEVETKKRLELAKLEKTKKKSKEKVKDEVE